MPNPSRLHLPYSAILLAVIAAGLSLLSAQEPSTTKQPSTEQPSSASQVKPQAQADDAPTSDEETAEEELAPAAVDLDVSKSSPLIQTLYQATRETKEQPILAKLEEAKKLIDGGADIKATDVLGRTALHWAVFGSSYNTKPKIIVAYEEIADALIQRGVDINREDGYQDTALDYLLYSPNFEMQTLLIENSATSGFLAASFRFMNEISAEMPKDVNTAVALSRQADLTPGSTLSVRLDGPVYSDRSRTGDPITATVTYPLCKNGEWIECKPGELLLSPGTKVNGTILFAQKAPDKYSRPRLVLDFSNIVHKDGQRSPLYARVLDVDNARETVRNNEILGIVQPHASTKASLAMAALSASNPIAGYTVKGVQTVYGLSIRREVKFPAGTDIQVQIVRPSMLKEREPWQGWPKITLDPQLQKLAQTAPLRTYTAKQVPSDMTNLLFIGSRQQLVSAFNEAGWFEADDLGVRSAIKAAQATVRDTGYTTAPVSTLQIGGHPPDLVFQKSLDTFAKRHHVRIWKLAKTYNGQEIWVGAGTHDIDTSSSRAKTKWSHRIDPHIDRERDWAETDLLFAGTAIGYVDVERPSAPHQTTNATGDDIVTDGKITVVKLAGAPALPDQTSTPVLASRPAKQ
jgi:LssY C-terminus